MAIAFRAAASTTVASQTTVVIAKPTGTVDGDVMVASIYSDVSISSAPAGWTLVVAYAQPTVAYFNSIYWKRASGEGSSYSWSASSGWTGGGIVAYSGVLASGSPIDVYSTNGPGSTSNTVTWASVTTTIADAMLIAANQHYNTGPTYSNWTAGLTERIDDDVMGLADGIQAAAGASGAKSASITIADWTCAVLLALKPETGGGGPTQPPRSRVYFEMTW